MRHPIQRLHFCAGTNTLFAGIGGTIQCFRGTTGVAIASWNAPQLPAPAEKNKGGQKKHKNMLGEAASTDATTESTREGSPSKKRKVHEKEDESTIARTSLLGVGAPKEEVGGGRNSITMVIAVQEGRYLVVVTNEDKTVRVFEIVEDMLEILSERAMPKRPCAISITDSDTTILLADKFGDVYALPLLPPTEEVTLIAQPKPTEKLTVAQLEKAERDRLAEVKRKRTTISLDLPFTHTLLLGHVSMLIDVLTVTLPPATTGAQKDHTYVLTADRDEHIRVSRYPQSYIIEGFCLGHESFVSKLLVPSWNKTTLVSGGGDEFLLIWDWVGRKVLQRVEVGELVSEIVGGKVTGGEHGHGDVERESGEKEFKVTVVGMWEIPRVKSLLVAFESVPAVFVFTHDKELVHIATIPISGSPLDIAVDTADNSFWVSVIPTTPEGPTIEKFAHVTDQWENVTEGNEAVIKVAEETAKVEFSGDEKLLNEGLLYATGLLRKGTRRAEKGE